VFRDEAVIEVAAGKGGDGLVSFRREKYVSEGGPDGGDGGHGGDVILRAVDTESSLLRVGRNHHYRAENGRPGGPRKRSGRRGKGRIIEVPVGTLVRDAEHGNLLKDLAQPGAELVAAEGGRGGHGNTRFATPVRQVPRQAKPGLPGESRKLLLELKLVAEVGLIGLPNAGKSTFLAAVTAARPKVANYPFTTLQPHVGMATVGDYDTLVIADLPGLIEGAAEGHGLGHQFLRHVERCSVLLHLVDVSAPEPAAAYRAIEQELAAYSQTLATRPHLVVASKVEDEAAAAAAGDLALELGQDVLTISSVRRQGLQELLAQARELVRRETGNSEPTGLPWKR
jgi:GTP-binding protein